MVQSLALPEVAHGHESEVYGTKVTLCKICIAVLNELTWDDRDLTNKLFRPIVDRHQKDKHGVSTGGTRHGIMAKPQVLPITDDAR
jgi:hypothetical protein